MSPESLRVIFMGTPTFAVPSLEAIYALGCQVVGVVSQPDRPKGRGRQLQRTPIAEVAHRRHTPLFQWARLNDDSFAQLRALDPHLIVVVAYGKILPKRYLELPKFGCLNVHASLLPKYRGAAPIQWAVINGEVETGVSIMRLDEGMDTGDVASTVSTPIQSSETSGQLHDRLSELGVLPLQTVIRSICEGHVVFKAQNHADATHAPMLSKAQGEIQWQRPAAEIYNHVRGMSPWPGAYMRLDEGPLKIHQVRSSQQQGPPGIVIAHEADGPVVGCGSDSLILLKLQRPGRRPVSGADFLRGGGGPLGLPLGAC